MPGEGQPGRRRTLLVLGGGSDIGVAICERYLRTGPARIVLAGRSVARMTEVAARLTERGAVVEVVEFDATAIATHQGIVEAVFASGDIDLAVVAFGVLGDQHGALADPAAAAEMAYVNYVGAIGAGVVLANAMRRQGHGTIVALSSAGVERPRGANFVYGSSKAGTDFFYRGLADSLTGTGVRVVVVRPGQVRTKMTADRHAAPLTTEPDVVATAVVRAVARGRRVVWVPAALRLVIPPLRLLPRPLFRRILP
jgi:decaprenylphospho-beta-D-erythro-pentofuranosid-2-ulose 2-reductase